MTSSLTVSLSGKTSILQSSFFPEISLDKNCDYSCALLDFFITGSEDLNGIVNSGVILIDCDIISDSYINGKPNHTIHQFAVSTSNVQGRSFVEIPKHLNYFPLKARNLRSIQIFITDRQGKILNTNGGDIICRINIKRTTA